MPIQSTSMPTLMNKVAAQTTKLTMACLDAANLEAFYPKFFRNTGAISGLSFTDQDYEPGGPMANWPESTALPEQDFHEGYSLKLSTNHFGGKFLYSYITLKAGKKELINRGPKLLADSEVMTREILAHSLLIYGATAIASIPKVNGAPMVYPVCGDGVALFSASHRWRSNDVILNSNTMASYYHPTQTGVFAVNKQVGRWRQPNNQPMNVMVDSLLVPRELSLITSVFQQSEQNPLDATNAKNLFNKLVPGGVIVDPHLPGTSDWFALTNVKNQRPQIRELQPPRTDPIPFDVARDYSSGTAMITSYAMGPSVHGWMSIVQVSGTPGDVTNSLL